MLLTQKLLRYFNSVFDKDARSFTAFRIQHESGAFRWKIADRVLTGFNGDEELFSVALEGYTIRTLLEHLATLPGITVTSRASSDQLGLSACALIDGDGRQAVSNGDRVDAFTSVLWAYLESLSVELKEARVQIGEALRQMSVKTAEAEWLDEWGGYFGIPRDDAESDASYSVRIIAEVMRPRGNNKAIEIGLQDKFNQASQVIDLTRYGATFPIHNGVIAHNAAQLYNASAIPYYGLFKVVIGYDLLGGADISGYVDEVRKYIDALRDAGTHLESVELSGSQLAESFPYAPTDGTDSQALSAIATLADALDAPSETVPVDLVRVGVAPSSGSNPNPDPFDDSLDAPSDGATGSEVYSIAYEGVRTYNGAVQHLGGTTQPLSLS